MDPWKINESFICFITDLAATELTASSLKEAIEILEFVLMVTSGNSPNNIVPIYIRYPLIKALVLCKGLLHQPLPKNYGHDNDSKESQGPMSKALYVLEAMLLQSKGIVEFPACPNVTEVIRMVELSVWTDNVLLLQVWAELSVLTFNMEDIKTATECSNKALACRTTVTKDLKKSSKKKRSVSLLLIIRIIIILPLLTKISSVLVLNSVYEFYKGTQVAFVIETYFSAGVGGIFSTKMPDIGTFSDVVVREKIWY